MSKNFIIPLVVYPFDVMVSLNQTDDELKKELSKIGVEWNETMKCSGKGQCVMTPDNQTLIRLSIYPVYNEDYATLQHEIFHAVSFILNDIGMKLVINESDEAYAYLIGYLTKEIYNKI